jgi:hypothetical protein
MKKLDSQNLFAAFSLEGDSTNELPEVPNDSFILFGTVLRGVESFYIIDQLYQMRYKDQYELVREKIKLKYFTGLMKYIHRIDDMSVDTIMYIEDEFGGQAIKYALEEMLQFFEQIEHYEECIILKKYFDIFLQKKLQ